MASVGLIDVDGHNFPNLALMKLSAYHKGAGDLVEWYSPFNSYDIVYKSKVFTFSQDYQYYINAKEVYSGGTGYGDYSTLFCDDESPDYELYNTASWYDNSVAYGFLTRGCPNKCSWCVVPKKEGNIRAYMDIEQITLGRKKAVLMDNNVLASDYGLEQIDKIAKLGVRVDFNQGIDARLINDDVAKLLSSVRWLSPIRLACDTKSQMPSIRTATELLRKYGAKPKNYFVYVLVKDIPDALERVNFLKGMGLDPFAQPYRDFENNKEPTKEQRRFARWVNHKAIFKSIEYEQYVA